MSVERRRCRRSFVRQYAIIVKEDGSILGKCLMVDVSAGGARLKLAVRGTMPPRFVLVLSRDGRVRRRCVVAWQSGPMMGVHFISSKSV
jgi:hypothetical protein